MPTASATTRSRTMCCTSRNTSWKPPGVRRTRRRDRAVARPKGVARSAPFLPLPGDAGRGGGRRAARPARRGPHRPRGLSPQQGQLGGDHRRLRALLHRSVLRQLLLDPALDAGAGVHARRGGPADAAGAHAALDLHRLRRPAEAASCNVAGAAATCSASTASTPRSARSTWPRPTGSRRTPTSS